MFVELLDNGCKYLFGHFSLSCLFLYFVIYIVFPADIYLLLLASHFECSLSSW